MNQRAELLKTYLEEKEINVFAVEEVNDEVETVVFRSGIDVHGDRLPFAVYIDNGPVTMMRTFVTPVEKNDGNKLDILELINTYNTNVKFFRYGIINDNLLVLDCSICYEPGKLDIMDFNNIIELIIQYLTEVYDNLMADLKELGAVKKDMVATSVSVES